MPTTAPSKSPNDISKKRQRAAGAEVDRHDGLVCWDARHIRRALRSGDERGRNAQFGDAVGGIEVQLLPVPHVEDDRHRPCGNPRNPSADQVHGVIISVTTCIVVLPDSTVARHSGAHILHAEVDSDQFPSFFRPSIADSHAEDAECNVSEPVTTATGPHGQPDPSFGRKFIDEPHRVVDARCSVRCDRGA